MTQALHTAILVFTITITITIMIMIMIMVMIMIVIDYDIITIMIMIMIMSVIVPVITCQVWPHLVGCVPLSLPTWTMIKVFRHQSLWPTKLLTSKSNNLPQTGHSYRFNQIEKERLKTTDENVGLQVNFGIEYKTDDCNIITRLKG